MAAAWATTPRCGLSPMALRQLCMIWPSRQVDSTQSNGPGSFAGVALRRRPDQRVQIRRRRGRLHEAPEPVQAAGDVHRRVLAQRRPQRLRLPPHPPPQRLGVQIDQVHLAERSRHLSERPGRSCSPPPAPPAARRRSRSAAPSPSPDAPQSSPSTRRVPVEPAVHLQLVGGDRCHRPSLTLSPIAWNGARGRGFSPFPVLWRRRVLPPGPEELHSSHYVRVRRFKSRARVGPPARRSERQPSLFLMATSEDVTWSPAREVPTSRGHRHLPGSWSGYRCLGGQSERIIVRSSFLPVFYEASGTSARDLNFATPVDPVSPP